MSRKWDTKRDHTLVFVLQVSVSTQVLHEVFTVLQLVIPSFNVLLVPLRKDKTLQTHAHTNTVTVIAVHMYMSVNKIKQNLWLSWLHELLN